VTDSRDSRPRGDPGHKRTGDWDSYVMNADCSKRGNSLTPRGWTSADGSWKVYTRSGRDRRYPIADRQPGIDG
jgi:hypothetical protein